MNSSIAFFSIKLVELLILFSSEKFRGSQLDE